MSQTRARAVIAALLGVAVWGQGGDARAGQVHYVGKHPVVGEADAFCYIEVPHVHVYAPTPEHRKALYVVHDDAHHFVGDPVGFGYDGDKHAYYGHHPIQVDVHVDLGPGAFADEYCYLDGPHYHDYAPPADVKFELKAGASWYVGKFPPRYHKHRKARGRINVIYKPLVYVRPVVVVAERPAAYVGPIVEVEAPGVIVETPSVRAGIEVHVPVPSIEIGIGVPGVIVERHHHHHHKHKKHKKHRRGRGHRHH